MAAALQTKIGPARGKAGPTTRPEGDGGRGPGVSMSPAGRAGHLRLHRSYGISMSENPENIRTILSLLMILKLACTLESMTSVAHARIRCVTPPSCLLFLMSHLAIWVTILRPSMLKPFPEMSESFANA